MAGIAWHLAMIGARMSGTYTAFLCDAKVSSSVGNRQNVVPRWLILYAHYFGWYGNEWYYAWSCLRGHEK